MSDNRRQNRKLAPPERETAKRILEDVRAALQKVAGPDRELLFAIRRYVYIRLTHDERGKPPQRRLLKLKKIIAQNGRCALCQKPLPERHSVLDRLVASDGYTDSNTRVLCPECDASVQAERKFA